MEMDATCNELYDLELMSEMMKKRVIKTKSKEIARPEEKMYIFKFFPYLASISFPIAYGWYYVRAVYATVNEEDLLCFPTVRSIVTRGVIICDVETDMASYHAHTLKYTPQHLCTAI